MVSKFETNIKKQIFYVGISMVCMITLQKRASREIAPFDATRPLHLIPLLDLRSSVVFDVKVTYHLWVSWDSSVVFSHLV